MQRKKLTKKQKGFVNDYVEMGNGTLAALNNYDVTDEHVAAVIASENLTKPDILAYLESKATRASERIVELSEQAENLPVSLAASKDILDRAGFKPIDRSISINVDLEPTERIMELAKKLKELDN